ncbi:MAG: hypothetical protein ACOH16_06955 [Propionibacteriaceae bacterium]
MTNKNLKKLIIGGVAAVAVGGSVALGAVTVASADSSTSPTPSSPSATSSTDTTTGRGGRGGSAGASQDTAVTGDEATKASAAVTAKDSSVTVTSVRKDPDGSYDVLGTKAGAKVMYDVSPDLATVTQAQGGKGGGGGASKDTPVTGDEAAKVSAAVTAKDSAVTVTEVRKDADGSYDVLGTKAGAKVFYEVSADLSTVTTRS